MKKTIGIEGMMCVHCEKKVKDALSKVTNVLEVSHEKNLAVVETELSNEALTSLIEDLGYEVTSINEG